MEFNMQKLRCAARNRRGTRCGCSVTTPGKRVCRLHGGHPRSGVQTPEGRARINAALKIYWARRRAAKALAES
jgi:hypothetical protein